ncbi:hypothetical protein [Plantactinospora soyae]|uniref:Uncharacterized protein n=1 Tax=Plantactinospora soyae TaxID=1544732 RepID=A0A927MF83_9ACTN|nr:hypothetical protein [Plantactinospora soyae]MBE1492006.1 hypothetical protein [Plantactinospora soyae]
MATSDWRRRAPHYRYRLPVGRIAAPSDRGTVQSLEAAAIFLLYGEPAVRHIRPTSGGGVTSVQERPASAVPSTTAPPPVMTATAVVTTVGGGDAGWW